MNEDLCDRCNKPFSSGSHAKGKALGGHQHWFVPPVRETYAPCSASDRSELFCWEHNAYWSIRQDYCESTLSYFPRLVRPPGIFTRTVRDA